MEKGQKVKLLAGDQAATPVGQIYEVVAGFGDGWLTFSGKIDPEGKCNENEFFIKDNDGDCRYQVFPEDALCKWQLVE